MPCVSRISQRSKAIRYLTFQPLCPPLLLCCEGRMLIPRVPGTDRKTQEGRAEGLLVFGQQTCLLLSGASTVLKVSQPTG